MAYEKGKYRVWNPEEGDEEDGRDFVALGHEYAAEAFAERQCSRDTDYYSSYADGIDLSVRLIDGTEEPVFVVGVTVEQVPEFSGRIKRRGP